MKGLRTVSRSSSVKSPAASFAATAAISILTDATSALETSIPASR
jgi:hypothetical protein